MKYPFKTKDENLKSYIFQLKEVCIIEHEDNWFKEKSHTKLYPNLEEAKAKVSKPYSVSYTHLTLPTTNSV